LNFDETLGPNLFSEFFEPELGNSIFEVSRENEGKDPGPAHSIRTTLEKTEEKGIGKTIDLDNEDDIDKERVREKESLGEKSKDLEKTNDRGVGSRTRQVS
jgi:hypothetical protein